jgi:hypothetical protein
MRKTLIILSIGCLVLLTVGYRLYNKQHRSVAVEKAIEVSATDLFEEYLTNETDANKKYLDRVLSVTGIVSETTYNQDGKPVIMLSTDDPLFGIHCTLEEENEKILVGNTVTIKGICTGYLSDVVITSGILIL